MVIIFFFVPCQLVSILFSIAFLVFVFPIFVSSFSVIIFHIFQCSLIFFPNLVFSIVFWQHFVRENVQRDAESTQFRAVSVQKIVCMFRYHLGHLKSLEIVNLIIFNNTVYFSSCNIRFTKLVTVRPVIRNHVFRNDFRSFRSRFLSLYIVFVHFSSHSVNVLNLIRSPTVIIKSHNTNSLSI